MKIGSLKGKLFHLPFIVSVFCFAFSDFRCRYTEKENYAPFMPRRKLCAFRTTERPFVFSFPFFGYPTKTTDTDSGRFFVSVHLFPCLNSEDVLRKTDNGERCLFCFSFTVHHFLRKRRIKCGKWNRKSEKEQKKRFCASVFVSTFPLKPYPVCRPYHSICQCQNATSGTAWQWRPISARI